MSHSATRSRDAPVAAVSCTPRPSTSRSPLMRRRARRSRGRSSPECSLRGSATPRPPGSRKWTPWRSSSPSATSTAPTRTSFDACARAGSQASQVQVAPARPGRSYRTNGGKVLDRNHIALPKLGNVRAKVSRPLQGRFISVTVSLDAAGRYFATFLCTDVPAKDTTATDREVGIDLGVETLATLSGWHENRESAPSQEIRAQARAGAAQALPQEGRTQGREAERQVPEAAEEGRQDSREDRRCQNRCPSQGHDHARGREPSPVHGEPERQGHGAKPSSGESRVGCLVR